MAKIDQNNPLYDQLGIQKRQAEEKKDKDHLGQREFLELMMAQLKHQDPMNPQDNQQFIAQMAQFSTVSGLQDMQQSFESLSNSLVSNQALQASSMVGRFVMVPGDKNYLPEGEGERFFGALELEQSSPDVRVSIYDDKGQIVKTLPLGTQDDGLVRFAWDGTGQQGQMMPAGMYEVRASAVIDGESQALDPMVVAPVESVTLGRNGGKMQLNVAGLGALDMSAVREIL